MRQGLVLVLAGLSLGVVGALALAHHLSGLLFGVEPNDPATLMAVSVLLLAAAAAACWLTDRQSCPVVSVG